MYRISGLYPFSLRRKGAVQIDSQTNIFTSENNGSIIYIYCLCNCPYTKKKKTSNYSISSRYFHVSKRKIILELLTVLVPSDEEYIRISDMLRKNSNTPNTMFIKNIYKLKTSPIPDFEKRFPNHDLKFHGTSDISRLNILKNGFKLGSAERNMFGGGIYSCDDPNKGFRYTKGAYKILVVKVFLGKMWTKVKSDKTINKIKLTRLGYDSVFSPGGNKSRGGCNLSEYVVYDQSQITPAYVVEVFRQPPRPN